jgi:hypothetical protein
MVCRRTSTLGVPAVPLDAIGWAKVITSSDLAVCRGKYTSKHGDSSCQLCTCKSAALETIEHFYFECAAYTAVRQPLTDAATGWYKLSAQRRTRTHP